MPLSVSSNSCCRAWVALATFAERQQDVVYYFLGRVTPVSMPRVSSYGRSPWSGGEPGMAGR